MTIRTAPPAPSFPADWNVIAAPGAPFSNDPMHFPFPVSPLMASTQTAFAAGYLAAAREIGLPITDVQVRDINHFRYERFVMAVPATGSEGAAQAAAAEAATEREIARMIDRWHIEHRPRVLELHAQLRRLRPRGLPASRVAALLDEADAIHQELWTIHFRIAIPMLLAMQAFRELHADLFGDDHAALTMMAGSPTESIKAAFGLADLAERARVLELAGLFLTTPVGDLLPELRTSDAGRAFLIELNGWLETYGLRQDLFDFATVTWREDPVYALASVRNYLETGHDPRADHDTTGRAARLAYETAQVRLATYPAAIREQFEQRLQAAREGAFLQEEHNFYIDQQGMALLRLFYLEIGEHLRDVGMLDEAADVFMLRIDEIRRLNDDIAPARHRTDIRPLVAGRRDELAQAALLTPPPVIGDPSTFPKPPDGPMMRAVTAFFGGPPQVSEVSGQLRGNPGSRGVASGSARVARTLAEAQALRAGEILVAVTTMPPWTPLFGIAAAVVTETGGALSHCAIVAREYGVPAVVGVAGATTAIRTGQRLTVDGASGLVTIEP